MIELFIFGNCLRLRDLKCAHYISWLGEADDNGDCPYSEKKVRGRMTRKSIQDKRALAGIMVNGKV